jgi:UDP-N-acetylmuramate--alanine ligase
MTPLYQRSKKIHFVGIGGVGMSGIAEILLRLGHCVSGSDMHQSEATRRLERNGARITYGHHSDAVAAGTDVVVISSAVKFSNPEIQAARALKIPVIPRAEMLAELMRTKCGIAVAGTHGKTTTTSLVAAVLARAQLDPTVVIGGKVHSLGSNAQLGTGELMVAEADESDGTFLLLTPTITVVTNIDPEHLDYYGDMDRVRSAYLDFINRVPFFGAAVLCLDDVTVRALLPQVRKRAITYGASPDADLVARNLTVRGMETYFDVERNGEPLGELRVRMPGRHQALNALAALAVATELGVSFDTAREALSEFGGIHRRFEVCGEQNGILVVSDYGHHPTEIRATLEAAREGFERRLVVLFQPHRYTRTRDLFGEFLSAFDVADVLMLTDIYAAGEDPIEGVTGEVLYHALKRRGHLEISYVADWHDLAAEVHPILRPGDMVLVLGAGNIHEVGQELVNRLSGTQPAFTMQ